VVQLYEDAASFDPLHNARRPSSAGNPRDFLALTESACPLGLQPVASSLHFPREGFQLAVGCDRLKQTNDGLDATGIGHCSLPRTIAAIAPLLCRRANKADRAKKVPVNSRAKRMLNQLINLSVRCCSPQERNRARACLGGNAVRMPNASAAALGAPIACLQSFVRKASTRDQVPFRLES
jgi:hypothetical protein